MGNIITPASGSLLDAIAGGDAEAAVGALKAHPELVRKGVGTKRRNLYHFCAKNGQLAVLERLCEHVWRNMPDSSGCLREDGPSPSGQAHPDIRQAVNAYDQKGLTPLSLACKYGHARVVDFLISQGADPWLKDRLMGRAPLHHAARNNHPDCIEAILAHPLVAQWATSRSPGKRLVDVTTSSGYTPLHYAAASFAAEAAAALVRHGADPNAKTWEVGFDFTQLERGSTPLHAAARLHNLDVANLLLKHWHDTLKDRDVTDPRVVENLLRVKPYQLPGVKLNQGLFRVLDPATPIKEIVDPFGEVEKQKGTGEAAPGSWKQAKGNVAAPVAAVALEEKARPCCPEAGYRCLGQESDQSEGGSSSSQGRSSGGDADGAAYVRKDGAEAATIGRSARLPKARRIALDGAPPPSLTCGGNSKSPAANPHGANSFSPFSVKRAMGVFPMPSPAKPSGATAGLPVWPAGGAPSGSISRGGSLWAGSGAAGGKAAGVGRAQADDEVGAPGQRTSGQARQRMGESSLSPSTAAAWHPGKAPAAAWEAAEPGGGGGSPGQAGMAGVASGGSYPSRGAPCSTLESGSCGALEGLQEGTPSRRSLAKRISKTFSSLTTVGLSAGKNVVTACGQDAAPSPRGQAKVGAEPPAQPWAERRQASDHCAWTSMHRPDGK